MVKFDEDLVLQLNGAGAAALGVSALAANKQFNDLFIAEPSSRVASQHLGVTMLQAGAVCLAASSDKDTKKNICKAMGAGFALCAAYNIANVVNKTQKKEAGIGMAAVSATMSGLNFFVGFKK